MSKRNQQGWIQVYQKLGALWIHDGNPRRPHALLTSGMHSSGFFNSRLVISDDVAMEDAAKDLLSLLEKQRGSISGIPGIVGPQTGATRLASLLCTELAMTTRRLCFWASPEKSDIDGIKSMVFNPKEKELLSGHSALLCEDVLTTGGSVDLTEKAVVEAGGKVLPIVLVLVNRSGLTEIHGKTIIALINHSMPIWTPENCELCKQGSVAIRPKDNWDKLNAEYK